MRFLPVGADALLVEVDDTAAATALYDEALRRHVAAVDVVPAARTVLFAGVHDVAALEREVAGWSVTPRPAAGRRTVEVPTVYDGPDLEAVARLWDMSTREVVTTHTSCPMVVAFCGFAPGFAYCTGLPEERAAPGWRARAPASRPVPWAWPARSPASTRPPRPAAGSSSGTPTSCCGTTPGTSPRR
jgi:allophanate hydrolase subunit 1